MQLEFLIFDAADDGEGTGNWEAVASVRAGDLPAVLKEVQAVLDAVEADSPGLRGPLDEGGAWDADRHTEAEGDWTTVTLTLTGPWEWGETLMAQWSPSE